MSKNGNGSSKNGVTPSNTWAGAGRRGDGKIRVAGVSRGGGGFIPTGSSTVQAGDYLILMIARDGIDLVDELIAPEEPR